MAQHTYYGYQPTKELPDVQMYFYGRQQVELQSIDVFDDNFQALLAQLGLTLSQVTKVIFESDREKGGFGHIITRQGHAQHSGDGIILPAGYAMLGMTRDCLILVIICKRTKEVFVLHVGRPQLQSGSKTSSKTGNVVTHSLSMLHKRWGTLDDVTVMIAGGICAEHFRHDKPDARHFLEPFWNLGAVTDKEAGTIDLRQATIHFLHQAGIPEQSIECDHTCTWETEGWSSKRAHEAGIPRKNGYNLCAVVNRFSHS